MSREIVKGAILMVILIVGIVLQGAGVLDLSGVTDWIETQAHHWWAPVVLVGLMVVMYAFALPASTLMVVAGVMYRPVWAMCWTVLGGVAGGLAAYYLVRHLSAEWRRRHAESALFKVMQLQAGFFFLSALRTLPGFPHSVVNYSAGILRIPLSAFIASATLGFAVKGFVYASAVYHATHVDAEADALSFETLWPLAALSGFLAVGWLVRKWVLGPKAG